MREAHQVRAMVDPFLAEEAVARQAQTPRGVR